MTINESTITEYEDSSNKNNLDIQSNKFDVIEYINNNCVHFSLYEINDELVSLTKSIGKTQHESKKLVTNHFTKFIECHNMMRRIMQDMEKNEIRKEITQRAENTLKKLDEKINDIVTDVGYDIEERGFDERREYYIQKYESIFNLKKELETNLNNFEKFVKLVRKAKKELEQVKKSKFMCKKIEETREIQKKYLGNLFEIIRNENTSFEQACYLFELYFEISGEEEGIERIESTLLVNYKESTRKKKESGHEYVEYMLISLKQLINHLKNIKIINEGIKHFFGCLKRVIKGKRLGYIKIVTKQIRNCGNEIKMENESKEYFERQFMEMKVIGFREITQNKTLEEVASIYNQYLESTSKMEREYMNKFERINVEGLFRLEKEKLREIIYEYILIFSTTMKKRGYEYLKCEGNEIRKAQKCLGGSESQLNKKLKDFLKKCREEVIQNIAETLEKIIKQNNDIKSLIEILRIIDSTPEFHKNILFEVHEAIIKRPIVCFFVYKLANCQKPILTKKEYEIIERLNFQFGFLLKLN